MIRVPPQATAIVAADGRPRHAGAFHAVDHAGKQSVRKERGYMIAREHYEIGLLLCGYDNHRDPLAFYHTTNLLSLLRIPRLSAKLIPSYLNVFCMI